MKYHMFIHAEEGCVPDEEGDRGCTDPDFGQRTIWHHEVTRIDGDYVCECGARASELDTGDKAVLPDMES